MNAHIVCKLSPFFAACTLINTSHAIQSLNLFSKTVNNMEVFPYSKTAIREFQRMKTIREIALDDDIIAFLEEAHASLKANGATNPQGPFKRPLLHYAAMGNCTELLRFLLQNGAAVDCCDQNKRTPLSWAAEYDALESVKILLKNGAKINAEDDMFSTPLSALRHACNHKATETDAYLTKMGAKEKGAKRRWFREKMLKWGM